MLVYLCVHGHFYQPPREDPFTGLIPREFGAEPYHDFNEKIAAECYRPNAALGNFEHVSFDLGPTLASWLERRDPLTYRRIVISERRHRAKYGHSNALAHVYNHVIMPLVPTSVKRIQVAWGIADYRHRFGHDPEGMWLPETAVDAETLAILAEHGIRFTVLSPGQAMADVEPAQPYRVPLSGGRSIAVFFYHGGLSQGVSFDPWLTIDADAFSSAHVLGNVPSGERAAGLPNLLLVASEGELYGHHQAFRDRFLNRLLTVAAPRDGVAVTSLAPYLALHPPRRSVQLRESSSWSCGHGVARWRDGCDCTIGDSTWKRYLWRALELLAAKIDTIYECEARRLVCDPLAAAEDYLGVRLAPERWPFFLRRYAGGSLLDRDHRRLVALLEALYFRHLMLTSCGLYYEDLDRIEPRYNIGFAAKAIWLVQTALGMRLEPDFLADLAAARSWRTGRTGAALYAEWTPYRRPIDLPAISRVA